jgi:general nucleoside transport system ATP-binding protein
MDLSARGDLVAMRGITKRYGTTVANDAVDFSLRSGEIHALLGENGAGKTTLMNILFGLVPRDSGDVTLRAEPVRFSSPHDALAHGVGMVHQHFMLVPSFTVAQNVVLGSASSLDLRFRQRRLEKRVREAAQEFDMAVDPSARVSDLPVEGQQRVEILKLLYRGVQVLILDEPTAALGPAQVRALFSTLKQLRDSGHSVVIVTHKLTEVTEIADRVTVLKAGRNVDTIDRGAFDERSLAWAMTGREIEQLPPRSTEPVDGEPSLRVRNLTVHGSGDLHAIRDVSFSVARREILGVAGVEGNGQLELVEVLAGVRRADAGHVLVAGRDVTNATPFELHDAGVSVIPEDRLGSGLIMGMSVGENLALSHVSPGRTGSFVRPRTIEARARELLEEYDVRPADPGLPISSLSGGNQQKVVLARQLATNPKVVVASNPSRGLDVGAIEYVHRRLLRARDEGNAVVLVSNDLDELFDLSDRIIALYRGDIVYEARIADVSLDDLALAMAGTRQTAA